MDYWQKFDDDFRELFLTQLLDDEGFGVELWSAIANVSWYHESDSEKKDYGRSFRAAGKLIASMLCRGDYLDWYCSGPDGVVSESITSAMASKGWRYEIASELCLPPEAFDNSK